MKADLTGQRFGRLLVLRSMFGSPYQWECQCDCGNKKIIWGPNLTTKQTRSCGCLRRQKTIERSTKHGEAPRNSPTAEYKSWNAARNRCMNPNNAAYPEYGGRGIKVCKRWGKFENFLADMGRRPSSRHTLDRINNDDDYKPSNCRWATRKQQNNNRRPRRPHKRGPYKLRRR